MTLEDKRREVAKIEEMEYPLWDIPTNREEIRQISEYAMDLMFKGEHPLRPDITEFGVWEAVPKITMMTLQEIFSYLSNHRSTDVSEVYVKFGNQFNFGVSFMKVASAENDNTFNPNITLLHEMEYHTPESEYDDLVPADVAKILIDEGAEYLPIQFFDERETLKKMTKNLISALPNHVGKLEEECGIVIFDWTLPLTITMAFFRAAKHYLIEHKNDGPFGIELKLGRVIEFGISMNGEPEDDDYDIFVVPGQSFKVEAKQNEQGENGTNR